MTITSIVQQNTKYLKETTDLTRINEKLKGEKKKITKELTEVQK